MGTVSVVRMVLSEILFGGAVTLEFVETFPGVCIASEGSKTGESRWVAMEDDTTSSSQALREVSSGA